MNLENKVMVVAGPTASGKSALAIDIALALGCLENFAALFAENAPRGSLFESKEEKKRKRGSIK